MDFRRFASLVSLPRTLSASGCAQREVSLDAATQGGEGVYLPGFVLKGLSNASPDTGYGVSLSSDF